MRAVVVTGEFGLDRIEISSRQATAPGPGEVQLKMSVASLNYRDLLMVQGAYNPRQPLPLVPCSDGVGTVSAVGTGVEVGDRVCPIFAQAWLAGEPTRAILRTTLGGPLDGTLQESMCVAASGTVPVPDYLSDEEAATLPCAAVTAWSALSTHGGVRAGDTVLVQGTGGVSIFALQLGKAMGARVIVTSSSDAKLERAKALGADATINYKQTPKWGDAARDLTGRRGVDHVVEVGGGGTLEQSLRAIRPGGTISIIGVLSGAAGTVNLLPVLMQNVRLQGIVVGHRESFASLMRALETSRIHPVIDRTFALEDTAEALRYLKTGAHFGKVCIRHS